MKYCENCALEHIGNNLKFLKEKGVLVDPTIPEPCDKCGLFYKGKDYKEPAKKEVKKEPEKHEDRIIKDLLLHNGYKPGCACSNCASISEWAKK